MSRSKVQVFVLPVVAALVAAGCGSSSKSKSTSTSPAATTTSAAQPSSTGGGSSSTTGPVRATLRAASHSPRATKLFAYTLHATDASGKPLNGTVETEFAFAGQVVGRESPPTHQLKNGRLTDTVTFPSQAVGQPLELQTVVHTAKGSVTLHWPVAVKP